MLIASEYASFTIQWFSTWRFFKRVSYEFPWVWTGLLLGHMFVNTLPHSFGHPLVIDMGWPICRPRSGHTIWSAMTCRALNLLCLQCKLYSTNTITTAGKLLLHLDSIMSLILQFRQTKLCFIGLKFKAMRLDFSCLNIYCRPTHVLMKFC